MHWYRNNSQLSRVGSNFPHKLLLLFFVCFGLLASHAYRPCFVPHFGDRFECCVLPPDILTPRFIPIWALWYVAALFSVCLKFDQKFRRFGDYLKFYLGCANSDDTIVFCVPEYPLWRNCMSNERAVLPKSTNVGIARFSGEVPLSAMLTRFLRNG